MNKQLVLNNIRNPILKILKDYFKILSLVSMQPTVRFRVSRLKQAKVSDRAQTRWPVLAAAVLYRVSYDSVRTVYIGYHIRIYARISPTCSRTI